MHLLVRREPVTWSPKSCHVRLACRTKGPGNARIVCAGFAACRRPPTSETDSYALPSNHSAGTGQLGLTAARLAVWLCTALRDLEQQLDLNSLVVHRGNQTGAGGASLGRIKLSR